jgi:hypothetical protein
MKILQGSHTFFLREDEPYLNTLLDRLAAVADNVAIVKLNSLYKWIQSIHGERCEYLVPVFSGEGVDRLNDGRVKLLEFLLWQQAVNINGDFDIWYDPKASMAENLRSLVKHEENELKMRFVIFDERWKGSKDVYWLDGHWTLFEKLGNNYYPEEVKEIADGHYEGKLRGGATFEAKKLEHGYWGTK